MKPLEVASVIQVVFNLSQPTVHQIKVLVILTESKEMQKASGTLLTPNGVKQIYF